MLYVQIVVLPSGLDIWAFVLTKLSYQLCQQEACIINIVEFQVSHNSSTFLTICKDDFCMFFFKESLFIHPYLRYYFIWNWAEVHI